MTKLFKNIVNRFKKKDIIEIIPNCYEDLNISLYRWGQYQTTGDYNWFRHKKDFDGRQKRIVSKYLEQLEEKLNDDYFELIDDKSYKNILEKRLKCSKIISKYIRVISICNRFKVGFTIKEMKQRYKYIEILDKLGFSIPKINTQEGDIEEINKIIYACEQLKNQINILNKDLQQTTSKVKHSLEKELIQICLGLEMKIVKTKDISVIQFIELTNILKEKNEALRQSQEKTNRNKN